MHPTHLRCAPAATAQAEYGERWLQAMAHDIAADYHRKGLLPPGDTKDASSGSSANAV